MISCAGIVCASALSSVFRRKALALQAGITTVIQIELCIDPLFSLLSYRKRNVGRVSSIQMSNADTLKYESLTCQTYAKSFSVMPAFSEVSQLEDDTPMFLHVAR